MLERLAHVIVRRRWWVIGVWIVLTLIGAFSAGQLSKRWFQSFSIPGYAGYETNQKTLKLFGSGEFPPMVAVFHSDGDITKAVGLQKAVDAASSLLPGSRSASYWTTNGNRAYVSKDGHTAFATIYPAGNQDFTSDLHIKEVRAKLKAATPTGVEADLTGRDPLVFASADTSGPSVLTESLIGGVGALIILFFVFGTMPAVLMPIAIAIASILNTFTLVYLLTYITNVSIIVQYLIALVGLGVAIDYALLMIFRFRDELRDGSDPETAMVETMTHAGRSVIVSGSTVAVGLLSMVFLPLPFIRSIGIGGMLIPLVSVIAAITLLPAILSTLAQGEPPAGAPEAPDGRRPPRGRLVGQVGRVRRPPSVADCRGRARDRGPARLRGLPAERERGAGQVLPRHRRRDRRAPGTCGRGHLGGRDEAVRRAGLARRRQGRPS